SAGTPEIVADAVIGRWFTPAFAAANPEVVARHRAMIVATPAEGYAGCSEAIAGLDLRAGLAGIAAPTLVISAAQDPSIRPQLGRPMRSAITLAVLTALGRENEIEMHVRAALRNGLSEAEIGEVLLHTAAYAGVPAANAAFAVAQRTLPGQTASDESGTPPD